MAGSFNGSSSYIEYGTTPVTGVALTLACWFNMANVTATHTLISVSDSAGDSDYFRLAADGATGGDPVVADARRSTLGTATTSSGFTANTWFHGCAVFTSATSRAAYINGGNSGTNATSITPLSIDRIGVGVLDRLTRANFANGLIADVGIWNVALTTSDIAALAAGHPPSKVRPQSLVRYLPLVGDALDYLGGTTSNTSVTFTTHCRRFG